MVKAGYKQTEVGIIPEDWDVVNLSDAVTFLDNLRKPIKSQDRVSISGDYPYYGASGIVDYVNDYLFDDDLILLGEDGENILSRAVPLAFRVSGRIWVNNHAHVLRPKMGFDINYLTEYLESRDYSLLNSGTAQPKLNKKSCYSIPVVKPREEEQTAIATVLSDVDALIASLNAQIAKKRDIKTATMQQLLTGKQRLAGFGTGKGMKASELGEIPEDWEVVTIGEFSPLKRGFDLPNTQRVDGSYPVVYSNGIVNYHSTFMVKGPGVVTGRSGTMGKVHYVESDYWPHNTSLWVTSFTQSVPKYVYYLYTFIGFERFASGSGVPTLNRNDAHAFRIAVPNTKEEQAAIAGVLSAMDAEIAALEQRLGKVKSLKQGMMQELLTGRTRLV
jgi:type I restriction enzyme S subunit